MFRKDEQSHTLNGLCQRNHCSKSTIQTVPVPLLLLLTATPSILYILLLLLLLRLLIILYIYITLYNAIYFNTAVLRTNAIQTPSIVCLRGYCLRSITAVYIVACIDHHHHVCRMSHGNKLGAVFPALVHFASLLCMHKSMNYLEKQNTNNL